MDFKVTPTTPPDPQPASSTPPRPLEQAAPAAPPKYRLQNLSL
jgi:hypothetical protein